MEAHKESHKKQFLQSIMSSELDQIFLEFDKMEEELARIDMELCFVSRNDLNRLTELLEKNYEIREKIKEMKERIHHFFPYENSNVSCER